jgi:gliding-associated putative ABC transporter substrate-binding component GldG
MKAKVYTTAALIIGIIFILNLLSNEFHLRLDLTEGGQYTLSEATETILENLEEPVTIKAYFSQNLPANIVKTRQDFQELLLEYANRSNGMLQYEFINPNEKESIETEATNNGIQPVLINVREKDQVKQQKAFLGAVINLGDKQEVIPFIQPGSAMEYALSTAIKKLSITNKPIIGLLTGHGEATADELGQLNQQLSILYATQEVRLDSANIPETVKTLVVIRPNDTIPPAQLEKINQFLARGGNLMLALNRVNGNLQQAFGYAQATGWETWLQQRNIMLEDAFVVDAKCGAVTLQQQTPFGMLQSQLPFPYLPIAARFADHPASKGLENVVFEFASPISYVGDSSIRYTPLVFSSEKANKLKAPQYFDVNKQWTEADLTLRDIPMAGAFQGKLAGNAQSKLIVIGDGDFALSSQQQRRPPDNINLLSNSIDWLSDDTGLIALRTKGVTSRPIDELEDNTKAILKYTNFLLPVLLAITYGLIRMQRNRMKRFQRMSESF